ncbi:MAG: DUF4910 domain-containing protein [Micromonosporaceae bacterium]
MIDVGPVEADLAALTSLDRLQGSAGLARAAELVAERAEAAGLQVQLRWYPADPDRRWWTYAMPLAGSPVRARLAVQPRDGSPPRPVVAYPQSPMCLARGSASRPPTTAALALEGDLRDRFVLVGPGRAGPALVSRLAAAGALGFARESPARGDDADVLDRLEVPDGCPLVAFSVSARQAEQLRAAFAAGDPVLVEAEHAPPAAMPLVLAAPTGAASARSALFAAHLCHPAPGANDNASGVAALLALGRAIGRAGPDAPALHLLWAPEMVGAAAYAHDLLSRRRRPAFAVSVDMVGRPELPLIIEAPPDHLAGPLPAALDLAADELSPPVGSYTGAVALPSWPRQHTPFVGASDHLLFADAPQPVPAAALGGWPDPDRHSSRDELARVSAGCVARVAHLLWLAGGWLLGGGPRLEAIADRTLQLAGDRVVAAARRAQLAPVARPDRLSPYDADRGAATVRALGAAGQAGLARLAAEHPSVAGRCADHRARLGRLVDSLAVALPPVARPEAMVPELTGVALVRAWPGPWNLRALRGGSIDGLLDAYPDGYAWMTAVALAVDGRRDGDGVLAHAAASAQIELPLPAAADFLRGLLARGWVSPGPPAGAGPRSAPASAP